MKLDVQPDHVHLFVIIPPKLSMSSLMRHLKDAAPSGFITVFHISGKNMGNHFGPEATLSIRW